MRITTTLLAITAFLLAGNSFAQVAKIYPGTFCVADGLGSESELSYNWGVRAENKSPTTKVVNCPIIRDADSIRPLIATIYVYDSSREESVTCKFQSWRADGSRRLETSYRWSGSGFVGSRPMTFTGLSTEAGSSYNFLCQLPQNSYISSYKVNEN